MEHKIGDQNLELHFGPKIQSARHLIYFLSMGLWGSGGGSDGRAVASDTRDPQLKSQNWQIYLPNCTLILNDKNKENEAGNGPSLKKVLAFSKVGHWLQDIYTKNNQTNPYHCLGWRAIFYDPNILPCADNQF